MVSVVSSPVCWGALCLGLVDSVQVVGRHNVLASSKALLELGLLLLDVLLLLLDAQKLPVPHQLAAQQEGKRHNSPDYGASHIHCSSNMLEIYM